MEAKRYNITGAYTKGFITLAKLEVHLDSPRLLVGGGAYGTQTP